MPTSISTQITVGSTDMKLSQQEILEVKQLISLMNSTPGNIGAGYYQAFTGISGYVGFSGYSTGLDYTSGNLNLKIDIKTNSRSYAAIKAISKFYDERHICDMICRHKKDCIMPEDIIVRSALSTSMQNPFMYEVSIMVEISLERLDADLMAIIRNKQRYSINLLSDEIKAFYNNVTHAASGSELEEFMAWKASRSGLSDAVPQTGTRKVKV